MLETRFSHIVAFSDLLRGLLNEKRLIEVDYTKDCIDVYRDIVKYSLRITKDYRILAYAEANSSMDRSAPPACPFPSWVPDWSQSKSLFALPHLRDVVSYLRNEESLPDNVPLDKWETDLNDY